MALQSYQTDQLELDGLKFDVERFYDHTSGAPWDEAEGHGPVSEWTVRDKRPGERVLSSDRSFYRYYDIAEATRIAKRDGWGLGDEARQALTKQLGRQPTQGQITAEAVQRDYAYLRGWCNNDWHYCGLVVSLLDINGDQTHTSESLWGVEDGFAVRDDSWIEEAATELAQQISKQVGSANDVTHLVENTARYRLDIARVRQ